MKVFNWQDFKDWNVPPETLAAYCNRLLEERTTPVKLCPHGHDVIRADANFTSDVLSGYPLTARMTPPTKP